MQNDQLQSATSSTILAISKTKDVKYIWITKPVQNLIRKYVKTSYLQKNQVSKFRAYRNNSGLES